MIYAITNNKGGVGKTHTVFHLAGAFSERGHEVLAVDLDPQGNLTSLCVDGVPQRTLYDVLVDDIPLAQALTPGRFEHLSVVASSPRLGALEAALLNEPDAQVRLADALKELLAERSFEYVLLDCPPSLGMPTRNALAAADRVIIPIEADKFSVDGLEALLQAVQKTKQHLNSRLELAGILVSLFKPRRRIEQLYQGLLEEQQLPLFGTKIKDSALYREAIASRLPITLYRKTSPQAEAFRRLTQELEAVYATN